MTIGQRRAVKNFKITQMLANVSKFKFSWYLLVAAGLGFRLFLSNFIKYIQNERPH